MKRPDGFDRASPRASSRDRGRGGTAATERESTNPGTPSGGARDQVTEPIPIVPAAGTGEPATGSLRAASRSRRRFERGEVRRFTKRTRRRRTAWLISCGAVALLILIVAVCAFSPLMALRTITVVGTSPSEAKAVTKALSGQLGRPLPMIDYSAVAEDLSGFRTIRSYSTESHPPGTLVVRIVQREPIGLIKTDQGFDLVDDAGVVLDSSTTRPPGYPLIAENGKQGSPHAKASFRAAADVLVALPADLRAKVATISATTTDDVTLNLTGGQHVVWGSADRSDLKATVLADLIAVSDSGAITEYDVSSPTSAVVR